MLPKARTEGEDYSDEESDESMDSDDNESGEAE